MSTRPRQLVTASKGWKTVSPVIIPVIVVPMENNPGLLAADHGAVLNILSKVSGCGRSRMGSYRRTRSREFQ